jgi:Pvc16 N-terminal domain/Carboxypeptidase regulatory-like domain
VIRDLDLSLAAMLAGEATSGSELASAKLSFAVPDARWRGQGTGLELNIYLYRVHENRDLRSNERHQHLQNGVLVEERAPARVACDYLLTAWNKAQPVSGVEQEGPEHRLLGQALDVLLRNPELPSRYLAGLLAAGPEPRLVGARGDGVGGSADFWTGLGTYLRPSVTCQATLAFPAPRSTTGPPVTTARVAVGDAGDRLTIGGTVRDRRPPMPGVAGAWVRLAETGTTVVTDDAGRFRVDRLPAGTYTLVVRAVGYREGGGSLPVPSPAGYDVMLDLL